MKNRHPDLTLQDMLDYKNNKGNDELLYASQLPLKKLCFTLNGGYRVYRNGQLEYEGLDGYWAIKTYNEI